MRLTVTDEGPNVSRDAPNRDLPQAGVLRKDAEFCELDRTFLTADALKCITLDYPTPFYLYNGAGIQRTVQKLFQSFSFLKNKQVYLPVRFCPYRELIELLNKAGVGFFCETPEELQLVSSCGVSGNVIRYGSLILAHEVAQQLRELDATAVIYSVLNLPSVMPRKVDFVCTDYSLAGVVITSADLERSRFGLNVQEIARLIPLFEDIGAESFGLSLPTDHIKMQRNLYGVKLSSLKRASDMIEEACGRHIQRIDLETGYIPDYAHPDTLTDDKIAVDSMCEAFKALSDSAFDQTVLFSPVTRILAHFALFVTSVVGLYRHHGATIVVNATSDCIADANVRRRGHVSVAGKEWMDDRFLYYIAGLRASNSDCFKHAATVRPPEVGDLIVFHDVGAAVLTSAPHAALLQMPNGNVIKMTR